MRHGRDMPCRRTCPDRAGKDIRWLASSGSRAMCPSGQRAPANGRILGKRCERQRPTGPARSAHFVACARRPGLTTQAASRHDGCGRPQLVSPEDLRRTCVSCLAGRATGAILRSRVRSSAARLEVALPVTRRPVSPRPDARLRPPQSELRAGTHACSIAAVAFPRALRSRSAAPLSDAARACRPLPAPSCAPGRWSGAAAGCRAR